MSTILLRLLPPALAAGLLLALAPAAAAQGCVTSRDTSCGAVAEGTEGHASGPLEVTLEWKHSRADEHWTGTRHERARERDGTNVVNEQDVANLRLSLDLDARWSATLSAPWFRGSWSLPVPVAPGSRRFRQESDGPGDLILGLRRWILDPRASPAGNLRVGLGLKVPTGEEDVRSPFPDFSGTRVRPRPVDVSIQPGDGGWGGLLEVAAYRDVGGFRLYLGANYLANPRGENGTLSTPASFFGPAAVPRGIRRNSVPDQFAGEIGVARTLGAGFAAGVGLRCEGVPPRDRFGGNEGFRRPGYAVAVAPGLSWMGERTSVSVSVPITTQRNALRDAAGRPGDASFADWSLLASISVRF